MHKPDNFIASRMTRNILLFIIAGIIMASPAVPVLAQGGKASQTAENRLPDKLGEKWQAIGAQKTLTEDQWSVLPNAEILSEYRVQRLLARVYGSGKSRLSVEIFETPSAHLAYGLFTFNRRSLSTNRREINVGRYLVSFSDDDGSGLSDPSLIATLRNNLPQDSETPPVLPSKLPTANRIEGSEIYLIGPAALAHHQQFSRLSKVVDFTGGVEAVTSDYRNGDGLMNLIIFEYHTPQSATAGYARALNSFNSLEPDLKQRSLLKRIGNYVVEATNISRPDEAQKIIDQIKYNPVVYWEGTKLSDIPLEFRPLDPVAVEEANRTTYIIVRTFYGVGLLLATAFAVGLLAGGTFFYWRRYKRRKLGLDDLFSDAGESIVLDLDDYLLHPAPHQVKQIGTGEKT